MWVRFVLITAAVRRFGESGTVVFGASLLVISQGLTVLLSLGFVTGANYLLVQTVITTNTVCFGFGPSNPALSAAASNAAGKSTIGGALCTVQGFASLGQVGGLVLAGPLNQLGRAHFPFGFGACIASLLLVVTMVLKRHSAMQPRCPQP